MTDEDRSSTEVYVHPAMHLVTPLLVMAASWAVRKSLATVYETATGHHPPTIGDPRLTLRRAVLWTATTAATVAVAEMLIYRFANEISD